MDFDDTDQDKDKTAADRFDPEGGSEPVSDLGQVSIDEKLRRFANEQWVRSLVEDMKDDGDGKDATNLSDSVGHFVQAAAATGAMTSDMYSTFKAQMYRAIERNDREEKQQVQVSIAEDREEKKRKADEDAEEEFEGSVDRVKAEEKREREAWAQATHRFGNVEMTGEEWGEMATLLGKDSALRRQMIERLMKKGKSKEEAQDIVDQAKRASYLMSIPENQRTDEQKAELRKLEQNEDVQDVIATAKAFEKPGQAAKASPTVERASMTASVEAGTEMLDAGAGAGAKDATKLAFNQTLGDEKRATTEVASPAKNEIFASAPDLGEHYQKAVQATDPLDAEKSKPQQVAANDLKAAPPAAAPGSGFAV